MSSTTKAIVFLNPDEIQIQEHPLAELGPRDIRTRTLYSMVSPGTELRAWTGGYSAEAPFPMVPGYSTVAEIVEAGPFVTSYKVGDLVSCRGPMPIPDLGHAWGGQSSLQICRTVGETRPVLLPPGADPLEYVIAEIAAISLRGADAAQPRAGENALVIGQGLIGAFSAAWLALAGCRVVVTDMEQARLDRAHGWGVSSGVLAANANAEARLLALLPEGADIVVESSGAVPGVNLAHRMLAKRPRNWAEPLSTLRGDWPRLVYQAVYKQPIPHNPAFMAGEGALVLAPRDRGLEDRVKTVESIRAGRIQAAPFLDQVVPFTEAAEAYRGLRDEKGRFFSVVFDWQDA